MTEYERAFYLGKFMGLTELVEKGLTTPEHFVKRCIEIAKEYEIAKKSAAQTESRTQC